MIEYAELRGAQDILHPNLPIFERLCMKLSKIEECSVENFRSSRALPLVSLSFYACPRQITKSLMWEHSQMIPIIRVHVLYMIRIDDVHTKIKRILTLVAPLRSYEYNKYWCRWHYNRCSFLS